MIHIPPAPISMQAMADLLSTVIVLCRGQDRYAKHFWAYLCIKPSMADAFCQARNQGNFSLGDYGTILETGEGETATDMQLAQNKAMFARIKYQALAIVVVMIILVASR